MDSSSARQRNLYQAHQAMRSMYAAQESMTDVTAELLGINKTDHRCLDIIQRAGRISAGQLAEAANLSSGAITTAIDRLERVKLVRRVPDANDRRRILLEMDPEGALRGWAVFEPIVHASLSFFDAYSDEELELLTAFMQRCAEHMLTQATAARQRSQTAEAAGN